jgi:Type VI secretion system effector, Hcp
VEANAKENTMTRISKIYVVSSMLAALAFSANTASAGTVTVHTPTPPIPKVNVQPATGGAGAGKIKFNEFTIKKTNDTASPNLFKNAVKGAHYKNVKIEMRKAGGGTNGGADGTANAKPTFLKYKFDTVFTTKSPGDGVDPPPPPPPPPPK